MCHSDIQALLITLHKLIEFQILNYPMFYNIAYYIKISRLTKIKKCIALSEI